MDGRSRTNRTVERKAMLDFFGLTEEDVDHTRTPHVADMSEPKEIDIIIDKVVEANRAFVWLRDEDKRLSVVSAIDQIRVQREKAHQEGRYLPSKVIYMAAFRDANKLEATAAQVEYFNIISALMGGTRDGKLAI